MEDVRAARLAGGRKFAGARTAARAYVDVFGGRPKYEAAAELDDYGEIFGGVTTACSIPFLDLPPLTPEFGDGVGIDYDEIFGTFGTEIDISYDGLIETGSIREESRTLHEERFQDQSGIKEATSPESELFRVKEQFSSNSDNSNDGSLHVNTSFLKSQGESMIGRTIVDSREDSTRISQVHSVKRYNHVIGASPYLHNELSDVSLNIRTNDLGDEAEFLWGKGDAPSSSSLNARSPIDGRKENKALAAENCASENASEKMKSHSRSSSFHSSSSWDIAYTDATYLTITDINLRTQPIPVPPPSRPPPKLVKDRDWES